MPIPIPQKLYKQLKDVTIRYVIVQIKETTAKCIPNRC